MDDLTMIQTGIGLAWSMILLALPTAEARTARTGVAMRNGMIIGTVAIVLAWLKYVAHSSRGVATRTDVGRIRTLGRHERSCWRR